MPSGLYGSPTSYLGGGGSMSGGSAQVASTPLSPRNMEQAGQLNLPGANGGGGSGANSQQAAESSYANFEDVFNKNKNYEQKAINDATNTVNAAAGHVPKAGMEIGPHAMGQPQQAPQAASQGQMLAQTARTQAAPNTANPMAPQELQGRTLADVQGKSDMLAGYGNQQPALQAYGGSATKLGNQQTAQSQQADNANPSLPGHDKTGQFGDNPHGKTGGFGNGPGSAPQSGAPPAPTGANGFSQEYLNEGRPAPLSARDKNPQAGSPLMQDLKAQVDAGSPQMSDAQKAQLSGDQKANDMLAGWGQDSGLDVLQQSNPEASQYDADLMASAGGRTAQANMSKTYGDQATAHKKAIVDDLNQRNDAYKNAQSKYSNIMDGFAQNAAGTQADQGGQGPDQGAPDYTQGDPADDHALMNDILFGGQGMGGEGNGFSNMHAVGMTLNPADWATIGLGEAGTDVAPTSEDFGNAEGGGQTGIQNTWPQGKFIMAFNELVNRGVSSQARHAFLNFLKANPDSKAEYLSMKNPGYMARNMRQWMTSWDQANGISDNTSQVKSTDDPGAGGNEGYQDDEHPGRQQAAKDGWLTEWDTQARNGVKYPSRSGK